MSDLLKQITELQPGYTPSAEIAAHLQTVTMVAIVGPFAVGKSTIIDRLSSTDPEFGRVQSFTTRPQRSGEADHEYRFLPHDDITFQEILDKIQHRALVQYHVHPFSGHVYGSEVQDYYRPYMLLDAMSGSVEAMRRLPFQDNVEIALVSAPTDWGVRAFERMRGMSNEDKQARLLEAQTSLQWSIEQGDAIAWIQNARGLTGLTAEDVKKAAQGDRGDDAVNRGLGESMLKRIEESLQLFE